MHVDNAQTLIQVLQLADSAFPSGSFTCSWGVEACVQRGLIHDRATTVAMIQQSLVGAVGTIEGPAVVRAARCARDTDSAGLLKLSALLDSYAPAAASRVASRRVGRRFLQAALLLCPDLPPHLAALAKIIDGVHHVCAVGALGAALRLPEHVIVTVYLTSWCGAQVQAAARLIPLGQRDALTALAELRPAVTTAILRAQTTRLGRATATPLSDVGRYVQPHLERRLFVC
ncbi:MAG TPA: urease accessory UreF family protein [Chloroflexota bacterium]